MFSRIRYATKVLTDSAPKVSPFDQPDIEFEAESSLEVSKISRVVGNVIEILLVSVLIGIITAPFVGVLFQRERTHVLPAIGFLASLLAFGADRIIGSLNTHIRLQLRIGERIAPYFGHKLLRAVQTLRG